MEDVKLPQPKFHFFVCINDRTGRSDTPSCGPKILPDMVREIQMWILKEKLPAQVTKAKCLGYCNPDGGVMKAFPSQRVVKGLQNVDDIKKIILEELHDSTTD